MNNKIIFHIPFRIDPNRASASQIRPLMMLNAFKTIGYDVDVVMGNSVERIKAIKLINEKLKKGELYSFLYSESSTMPTLLSDPHHLPLHPTADFRFFENCKKHGIPIGLFYRDIHWRFEQYKKQVSLWKRVYANIFYKWDISQYKRLVDVIYLPSILMMKFLPELQSKVIKALPPGGAEVDNFQIETAVCSRTQPKKVLYVGGVGRLYNLELFLEAFSKLDLNCEFTICCRVDEFRNEEPRIGPYIDGKKVKVVHAKGQELLQLYSTHDYCCLFVKPIDYWEFAMPVKLFEYISFMKPIIAVKGTCVGNFVEENNIGWAVPFTRYDIDSFLTKMDLNKLKTVSTERYKAIKARNTWIERAKEVERDLLLSASSEKAGNV